MLWRHREGVENRNVPFGVFDLDLTDFNLDFLFTFAVVFSDVGGHVTSSVSLMMPVALPGDIGK